MNGYTGGIDRGERTGTVHQGGALLSCSCGGTAWVMCDGSFVSHSEPIDYEAEHIVTPFWAKRAWRYEIAG